MGHTHFKKKKKGWATRKAIIQRGGSFNPDAPTKKQQQGIDSFHDFWPLERGLFHEFSKKNPNNLAISAAEREEIQKWHLMMNIIRWLLINYSVPALGLTLNADKSLFAVAPTYDFNFRTYTTNKQGNLFFTSLLSPSGIEPKGRNYIKIPEASKWVRIDDSFASFKSLCQALFPGTNDDERNKSTMYIVCDSGPGEFRRFGEESVTAAIEGMVGMPGMPPDRDTIAAMISAKVSIAGAIAALAYALGGTIIQNQIIDAIIKSANESLEKLYPTKSIAPKAGKTYIAQRNVHLCNVIGLIYISPVIIVKAVEATAAAVAAGAAAAATIAAAAAEDAATILPVIANNIIPTAPVRTQLPPHIDPPVIQVFNNITAGVSTKFVDTDQEFLNAYVPANMLQIILSATQLITATILELAAAPMVAANTVSQMMAVTTAATKLTANEYNIGPFVKEISTPQRSADSATANPKPSTIPGDVYPIIYEFVAQGQQVPHAFPEPVALPAADLFYSDSNLYTDGRYEIRFEKHNWSPVTGLGFKFVIGNIQGGGQRYEIGFGIVPQDGNQGAYYNTLGPSAALLAACCLKRVLHPDPPQAAIAQPPPPIPYDRINQSLNYLLQGANRNNIVTTMTRHLETVGNGQFTNRHDMFHPYLHFKGDKPGDQFHQLPPELWFDIKRGGDRDQVMVAYQLSLLMNPDGSPKYPYLVFVTGDELCAAIAVKKGLATIYQTDTLVRFWPKGIVYGPALLVAPFTPPRPQVQDYRMYTNLPAGDQYSIQSWGGNQMKGGDYYTMSTYDQIQDGYGNKYDIPTLQQHLQAFRPQLLQELLVQQREQEQQQLQQKYQQLLQQYPQRQQQLQQQYEQEQQQLQQQPLKELDSNQLQELQKYAFIHNTQENLQKLLLMNFGSGVEIGKILFAMAALPDSSVICTLDDLITKLNQYRIIEYATEQINEGIRTIVQNSPNATAAAEQIFTFVRTPAYLAAAAQAEQAAQAPAQVVPQWVNDMFAILSFTAVPNETEHDPSIPIREPNDPLSPEEEYDIHFNISRANVELRRAHSITQEQAAAQADAREDALAAARIAPRTPEEAHAQAAVQTPQRVGSKRKLGGHQLDFEKRLLDDMMISTFRDINDRYRDNKMIETPDNPVYMYIKNTMTEYLNMPNGASIMASFYTFCHMMKKKLPSVKQKFTLKPSQSQTGGPRIRTLANYPKSQFMGTFTVHSNSTKPATFTRSNQQKQKQVQYVSARTGGKRHTKKKQNKRKKRETQRKRSH